MYASPTRVGDSIVTQNPNIPFTAAQLAQRRSLIETLAEPGSREDLSGRPGAGRFPVASQGNVTIPISNRLNPSDISQDNFTLQGLLSVIGSGLAAGGFAGVAAGAEAGAEAGTTTGAATGASSGGGGMFDDFTGGWLDGGGDVGYVPGPEDGYVGGDVGGGDYVPGPEDGSGNPSGLPDSTGGGLPNLPPGASTVIGKLLGGGGSKPVVPARPVAPGSNTGGDAGGVTNGIVAGGVGALLGNNMTGGGGFASRNDAAAGGFDNEASLANQLWQMYQQNYGGPGGITTQAIQDARNIDSPENQARVMGAAHADSAQATDAASRAAIERLRQYGVNPSSDRLASLNAQIQASGAAADAGAQTQARQHVVDTGMAARQTMAQMGNSLPGAAMTGLYSSGVGNAGLGRSTFDQANTVGTGIGKMIQPAVGGISDWLTNNGGVSGVAKGVGDWINGGGDVAPGGGFSNTFNGGQVDFGNAPTMAADNASFQTQHPTNADYKNRGGSDVWGAPNQNPGMVRAMSSSGGGGYSRGGLIHGPGTGTSDSIPAVGSKNEPIRLSNNEYIIPADVVRHKGVEFFDRLVGKHHAPVATGVRRA